MGTIVRHEFVVRNTGDAPLQITSVTPACGCTIVAEWTRVIAAGRTGVIPLQFNTAGLRGDVTRQVSIACNDPGNPTQTIEIAGFVWRPFDVTPAQPVLIVTEGSRRATTRVVRITNNLEAAVELDGAQRPHPSLSTKLRTIEPGRVFELHITATPPFDMASASVPIRLKTSDAEVPEVNFTTALVVQPEVAVLPNQLVLPDGPLSTALTPAVNIRNNGDDALQLSDATVNLPGVVARVDEMQPNRLFRVSVTFPAGFELNTQQSVEVSVKSNHVRFPLIRVPVVPVSLVAATRKLHTDASPHESVSTPSNVKAVAQ